MAKAEGVGTIEIFGTPIVATCEETTERDGDNGYSSLCQPSPNIENVVNQLKSAIVETYKLDGRRVKVLVIEKG
jgi:hypothetical protein